MGVRVSEMSAEITMVTASVTANCRNSRPAMSSHEQQRNQYRDERYCQGEDGKADLLSSLERRLERLLALFDITRDVLDHDDGVIDHETRGNGERHHRQIVEAEAGEIHDTEGADQG